MRSKYSGPGDRANAADANSPRLVQRRPQIRDRLSEGSMVTDFLGLLGSLEVAPWMLDASCANAGNPEAWFPTQGKHSNQTMTAIRVCALCPVAAECFSFAVARPELEGIWAGTTQRQRRAARKASA